MARLPKSMQNISCTGLSHSITLTDWLSIPSQVKLKVCNACKHTRKHTCSCSRNMLNHINFLWLAVCALHPDKVDGPWLRNSLPLDMCSTLLCFTLKSPLCKT